MDGNAAKSKIIKSKILAIRNQKKITEGFKCSPNPMSLDRKTHTEIFILLNKSCK